MALQARLLLLGSSTDGSNISMLRLPLAEHSMERVSVCNNTSTNFRRKHSCLTALFHAHFLNSHALSWCFNGVRSFISTVGCTVLTDPSKKNGTLRKRSSNRSVDFENAGL